MPARMSRKYKVITARSEHDAAKSALMNRDIEDYGCRRARGGRDLRQEQQLTRAIGWCPKP